MYKVDELAEIFRGTYNYKVQSRRLNSTGLKLQLQVNAITAKFVLEEDSPSTLLLVYYAGHGAPGQKQRSLELTG